MTDAAATATAPSRWDLRNVFSALDGDDYVAALAALSSTLDALEARFDAANIRRIPAVTSADDARVALVEELIGRSNDVIRQYSMLRVFVFSFFATNSYDTVAAREISKLEKLGVRFANLSVRMEGWLGSHADVLESIIERSELAAEHAFFLRWNAGQSQYLMSEDLEALAAELVVDGGSAFGKLQGNVTSQLKVEFDAGDGKKTYPVTVIQNFRSHKDGALRKRAYEAELAAWESIRTTIAASMNAVKGTAITLAKRRGRASVLQQSLDQNKIDQPTLDAMMGAIRESFPVFRRYLNAKAKKLRKVPGKLAWWDIQAPVPGEEMTFTWREARDFIINRFSTFSAELGDYAATAFDQNWIDGQPRDGKRGGAFCMPVMGVDESRILANFDGSFDQLSTLAHELGHGWHNHTQRGLPALLRGAPSTLAETASIFCETLVAEATLAETEDDARRQPILEAQISGAMQVCLDISSRFLFESRVIERREREELSADDFCNLMKEAQAETYGDAVDAATYHPYMWLWKPHYFSHGHNFYNFPYAFGHLFSLGLYAIYQQEGASFVPRYNELLRRTAQNTAAPLAKEFGINITTPGFWRDSLKVIEGQIERFEALKVM
ncbi:MAG: M3 family oligoendopeptidase [Planctomycetota bacterium]